jgi:hypothetical protein
MIEQQYPSGWNAERVKRLIDYYDAMTDEGMIAEDEAAAQLPVEQAKTRVEPTGQND